MPINIMGKQYATVAERIQLFYDDYRDTHAIVTDIVSNDDDIVIMKATIIHLESLNAVATGHAEEVRGSTNINKTAALENCETSAIGRALACFGLAGTEFASADEVATAIKQQTELKECDCGKKLYPVKGKSDYVRCYTCGFFRVEGDKLIKMEAK